MLQNKRFQSNETQEIITVIGDNGVFYNLSNGANIKKDIFFQKFSETVDANSFFEKQSAAGLAELSEKLRTVDTSKVQDIGGNIPPSVKIRQESVSEQVAAPPEYKEMLLRRFEHEQAQKPDLSQYKVYENDDEAAADFERRIKQPQQQTQRYQPPQEPYNQTYQPPVEIVHEQNVQQPVYLSPEEDAFRFFKSFKKVYPIKLSVDFDERIAEPNFIKMMAVNYEGDIIKFYTKEFMNRIYNDPGFLENKIYDKLRSIVFEEEQKKEKKPRQPRQPKPPVQKKQTPKKKIVIPSVPKEEREQIESGK